MDDFEFPNTDALYESATPPKSMYTAAKFARIDSKERGG
jgi:hypothetical protein